MEIGRRDDRHVGGGTVHEVGVAALLAHRGEQLCGRTWVVCRVVRLVHAVLSHPLLLLLRVLLQHMLCCCVAARQACLLHCEGGLRALERGLSPGDHVMMLAMLVGCQQRTLHQVFPRG